MDVAVAIEVGLHWGSCWGGREDGEGFSGHSSPGAPGMRPLLFTWMQRPGKVAASVRGLRQRRAWGALRAGIKGSN